MPYSINDQIALEDEFKIMDVDEWTKHTADMVDAGKLGYTPAGAQIIGMLSDDIIADYASILEAGGCDDIKNVLEAIGPRTAAAMLASVIVDGTARGIRRQAIVENMATVLTDLILEYLIINADSEYKYIKQNFKKFAAKAKNARSLRKLIKKALELIGIDFPSHRDFLKAAHRLFAAVVYSSELFTDADLIAATPATFDDRNYKHLMFSKKAKTLINDLDKFAAAHAHRYRPMIVQPKPWTSFYDGGYYTDYNPLPFVKFVGSMEDKLKYIEMLDAVDDIDKLRADVNALQNTAYVVNKKVLALINKVLRSGGDFLGVPSKYDTALPVNATPNDIRLVHHDNTARASQMLALNAIVRVANEFKNYDEFYLPFNLDFRGRAYCAVPTLNPQGSDIQKALLLFARKVPLGTDGHRWLKIHAANCCAVDGLDKKSFDERVAWVDDNMDLIKLVASGNIADPNFTEFMAEVDDPMLFVAVAIELAQLDGKKPFQIAKFKSAIPVSIDGSNNGLQHYAAILRSRVLADKVNLNTATDADRPNDVYTDVAAGITEVFEENDAEAMCAMLFKEFEPADVESVSEVRDAWFAAPLKIRRKTVKRPTMTTPYAVSDYGAREQIKSDALKYYDISDSGKIKFATVIGKAFLIAREKHCAAAIDGMDFLKNLAKLVNGPITWVTPCSFLADQNYRALEPVAFNSLVANSQIYIRYRCFSDKMNTRKKSSAIAPNFIHSQDASHMFLTIRRLRADADFEQSFFMIHDSFGCHAGMMDKMAQTVREVFVEMYAGDRLDEFRSVILALADADADLTSVAEIPMINDFDIAEVLDSPYFFA